jgi:hypothetical protein
MLAERRIVGRSYIGRRRRSEVSQRAVAASLRSRPTGAPSGCRPKIDPLDQFAALLEGDHELHRGQIGMARTTLLLGVLSATTVALGFVAQGMGFGTEFYLFARVLLPVTLFLGLATFVRVVQIQREGVVCVVGMNRIRRFAQEAVPAAAPYFVFSTHDDQLSLYRNLGTGVMRRPPRFRLIYALVQVPGVVAVVDAVIAGSIGGIVVALIGLGGPGALAVAGVTFGISVVALLAYWDAQMDDLTAALRVTSRTPAEELDAPI